MSPSYLESPYCEWKIVEFLKYEHSRFVQGQGVAHVYLVEIFGLDTLGFEAQAAAWVARVRQRNHVDLRPWYDEAAEALKRADVRSRVKELKLSIAGRLTSLKRIVDVSGNLPAHNQIFVGREVEMERLHKAAGLGSYGLISAVQGIGGWERPPLPSSMPMHTQIFSPAAAGSWDAPGWVRWRPPSAPWNRNLTWTPPFPMRKNGMISGTPNGYWPS